LGNQGLQCGVEARIVVVPSVGQMRGVLFEALGAAAEARLIGWWAWFSVRWAQRCRSRRSCERAGTQC
jgi:hypothetical protein